MFSKFIWVQWCLNFLVYAKIIKNAKSLYHGTTLIFDCKNWNPSMKKGLDERYFCYDKLFYLKFYNNIFDVIDFLTNFKVNYLLKYKN